MAFLHRSGEKRKSVDDYVKEEENMDQAMDICDGSMSGKLGHPLESEKRMRREIANSNERRRMQSINTGFESLKTIIPHHEGEKLSKAAILQQTTEYISNLEQEKTRLLSQNGILRQMLKELNCDPDTVVGPITEQITPPPKRKKRDTESSDEGISLGFDEPHIDELKKEVIELRIQLDREKKMRMSAEDRYHRSLPSFNQDSDKQREIDNQAVETQIKEEKKLSVVEAPLTPVASTPTVSTPTVSTPTVSTPTVCAPMVSTPVSAAPVKATSPTQLPAAAAAAAPHVPQELPATKTPSSSSLPQQAPRVPVFASSMSKRNLETIVEAIRHLEGDHIMLDGWKESSHSSHHIPQSEESQPESSSDAEDLKSESSGRDSPLCHAHHTVVSQHEATLHVSHLAAAVTRNMPMAVTPETPTLVDSKWHLLQQAACLVSRPGVIVQKLS